ncbi:MAG: endonuclease domain-containing protein [Fimbriiglobus sp.]
MNRPPSSEHLRLLYERARTLRVNMTPAETILWKHLRGRGFDGIKFRRQQPINEAWCIADFFCARCMLVIELDGETHVGRDVEDANRAARLESFGYRVLRFLNSDIYDDLDTVLEVIWETCRERSSAGSADPSPPSPLLQRERGAKP